MAKRSYKFVKEMVKGMFTDLPEVATVRELETAFRDNDNQTAAGDVHKACEELVGEGVLQRVGRRHGHAYEATDAFIEAEQIEVEG